MSDIHEISGYRYSDANLNHSHGYLLPAVLRELGCIEAGTERRIFDLGCGNGSVAVLHGDGWDVTGVKPTEGVSEANAGYPNPKLEVGSARGDLAARLGRLMW